MAENSLLTAIQDWYNQLNAETNIVSRCNYEQLTQQQGTCFDQLSEDIKKRYYGSGLNIPENLQGKRVLDVGCGSGSFVFILSKLVGPTGYVVGFDITEGLIETAKSQTDYHCKQWGYDKPNFEFRVLNAEKLGEAGFKDEEFDIIVSNGVFCVVPDKESVFKAAYKLLKTGGQFYLNDVYADKAAPEENRYDKTLWSMGTAGAMVWNTFAPMVGSAGFSTPHLTCAAPINITSPKYIQMLDHARYTCAGWRLFKLDPKATKQGSTLVTYKGGITDYPDDFPWDVDLTFKRGVGVEVDAELSTLLSSIYLSDCFSFQPATGTPRTHRNQNPFQLMDKLEKEGKLPEAIYTIE
ncbi:hypothetical protein ACOMHN_004193 [Nucella lapillus]